MTTTHNIECYNGFLIYGTSNDKISLVIKTKHTRSITKALKQTRRPTAKTNWTWSFSFLYLLLEPLLGHWIHRAYEGVNLPIRRRCAFTSALRLGLRHLKFLLVSNAINWTINLWITDNVYFPMHLRRLNCSSHHSQIQVLHIVIKDLSSDCWSLRPRWCRAAHLQRTRSQKFLQALQGEGNYLSLLVSCVIFYEPALCFLFSTLRTSGGLSKSWARQQTGCLIMVSQQEHAKTRTLLV